MKPTLASAIFLLLIFSCSTIKNTTKKEVSGLNLGIIGIEHKNMMEIEFQRIGKPNMTRALHLNALEVPFSKTSFKVYQNHRVNRGKTVELAYIDSLPKPTYISMQITDFIATQLLLNEEENSDVRNYLAKDENYKIVSGISLIVNSPLKEEILGSEALFLTATKEGKMAIALLNNKETVTIQLPNEEIFDYELYGFCWGLDRYKQKKIEAILEEGQKCPKGTEKKAYKLNELNPYYKL